MIFLEYYQTIIIFDLDRKSIAEFDKTSPRNAFPMKLFSKKNIIPEEFEIVSILILIRVLCNF